jgi:S-DNA-T family DNA segregation ATPase FtsK/SpoIIIE
MVKKAKKKLSASSKIRSEPRRRPSRPLCGLLLLVFTLLIAVAIFDFESTQFNATNPIDPNLVGRLGAYLGFYGFHFFGVAIFYAPFLLGWISARCWVQQSRNRLITLLYAFFALVFGAGLAELITEDTNRTSSIFSDQLSHGHGGLLGDWFVSLLLMPYLGVFGSYLVLLVGSLLCAGSIFSLNYELFLRSYFEKVLSLSALWSVIKDLFHAWRLRRNEGKGRQLVVAKLPAKQARELDDGLDDVELPSLLGVRSAVSPVKVDKKTPQNLGRAQASQRKESVRSEPTSSQQPSDKASEITIIAEAAVEKSLGNIPERRGDYVFPPLELLSEAPDFSQLEPEDHAATMQALVQTLEEFSVKVLPGEIHTGPVITRYEVKPAPGVRVEKIVNLDKNIALGLRAFSVRILAPVPGKGTVGIEVPNRMAQAVCMRDIIESKAWADAGADIPVVLGKDVTGKPIVADLTKMPHVLIAGSTGAGKTVCINAIIASLLYHSGPEDLRFIMVDPKVVEMQMYNSLPHMLIPVVTEAKKVPGALKWLIAEMEHRYQIFAQSNVRNIAGFNAMIAKNKDEQAKAAEMDANMTPEERAAVSQIEVPRDEFAFDIPKKKLPYIVCIIDELADLMMVAPADIETCIARIAQLARAAGIHLILATQRPSVNVITGVIKANLPSRISFKVASKVDSRTILDGGGAEALIGKGDMLFIPPGTSNLVRAQGAFVSDDEINAMVEFLKAHNDPPQFAEEVQRQIDADDDLAPTAGTGDDAGDDLLPAAIDVLRSTKRASTSMLQRRLRIGYNRAARLMEALEDQGVVGPENGSSPREILVDLDLYP